MKGTTVITLTADSITEALNRYLNTHLVQPVHVLCWSVDSAYGQPNVIVKFTETNPEQGTANVHWNLLSGVGGLAQANNYTSPKTEPLLVERYRAQQRSG